MENDEKNPNTPENNPGKLSEEQKEKEQEAFRLSMICRMKLGNGFSKTLQKSIEEFSWQEKADFLEVLKQYVTLLRKDWNVPENFFAANNFFTEKIVKVFRSKLQPAYRLKLFGFFEKELWGTGLDSIVPDVFKAMEEGLWEMTDEEYDHIMSSITYSLNKALEMHLVFGKTKVEDETEQEPEALAAIPGLKGRMPRAPGDNFTRLSQEQTALLIELLRFGRVILSDQYLNAKQAGVAFNILTGYSADGLRMKLNKKELVKLKTQENLALASNGQSKIWSTYYGGNGGPGGEEGWDLRISPVNGDIYMVGLASTGLPLDNRPGAYNWSTPGGMIVRFNSVGDTLWATYFGSSVSYKTIIHNVTVDVSGNVVVVGQVSDSTGFPVTSGAYQTVYGGGIKDAFAAKFSGTTNALLWCTYLGGSGYEIAYSVDHTKNDVTTNYYITEVTASSGFPISNPGFNATVDSTYNGGDDAFVTQLDENGSMMWSTFYGGSGSDIGYCITLDESNDIFVTGSTKSSNITLPSPNLPNAYVISTIDGTQDAFVTSYKKQSRELIWSTYFGGANGEESYSIECSGDTSVYIAGWTTTASDFPLVSGTNTQFGSRYYDNGVSGSKAFISMLDLSPVIVAGISNEVDNSNSFNVFPNPTANGIWVVFNDGSREEKTIQIFDITGKLAFDSKFSLEDGKSVYIDLSKFQNGMYFLRVADNRSFSTKKILITR